jgi:hypothetical protein
MEIAAASSSADLTASDAMQGRNRPEQKRK